MSATDRTNEAWLADLRADDPDAIADLHARLQRGLTRGLSHNSSFGTQDIEDFSQEAVLRVLDKLDSFRGDSRFTTWAIAIGVRVALTAARKKAWAGPSLDGMTESGASLSPRSTAMAPDRAAERQDLLTVLDHAIETALTDRQRSVIRGILAGTPTTGLVEQLDTNLNALYKLYHDARQKLKRALLEAGFDENDVRRELTDASE